MKIYAPHAPLHQKKMSMNNQGFHILHCRQIKVIEKFLNVNFFPTKNEVMKKTTWVKTFGTKWYQVLLNNHKFVFSKLYNSTIECCPLSLWGVIIHGNIGYLFHQDNNMEWNIIDYFFPRWRAPCTMLVCTTPKHGL